MHQCVENNPKRVQNDHNFWGKLLYPFGFNPTQEHYPALSADMSVNSGSYTNVTTAFAL